MRNLAIALSLVLATPALAAAPQHGGTTPTAKAGARWHMPVRGEVRRMVVRRGEHRSGFQRRPGYRFVHRGGILPSYWWGPQFGIADWRGYGFHQPRSGTRWVRYYDDALLIDRHGRVQDGRWGMDWDRHGERSDHDERGVPVHVGSGIEYPETRDWGHDERIESHGQGRYDRDYPYDHPYGGAVRMGRGGYTITETTVTTPTIVERIEYVDKVAVHRPTKRRHARRAARRCACK